MSNLDHVNLPWNAQRRDIRWLRLWLAIVVLLALAAGYANAERVSWLFSLPSSNENGTPLTNLREAELGWSTSNVWKLVVVTNGVTYDAQGRASIVTSSVAQAQSPYQSTLVSMPATPVAGNSYGAEVTMPPGRYFLRVRLINQLSLAGQWSDEHVLNVPILSTRPGKPRTVFVVVNP